MNKNAIIRLIKNFQDAVNPPYRIPSKLLESYKLAEICIGDGWAELRRERDVYILYYRTTSDITDIKTSVHPDLNDAVDAFITAFNSLTK